MSIPNRTSAPARSKNILSSRWTNYNPLRTRTHHPHPPPHPHTSIIFPCCPADCRRNDATAESPETTSLALCSRKGSPPGRIFCQTTYTIMSHSSFGNRHFMPGPSERRHHRRVKSDRQIAADATPPKPSPINAPQFS